MNAALNSVLAELFSVHPKINPNMFFVLTHLFSDVALFDFQHEYFLLAKFLGACLYSCGHTQSRFESDYIRTSHIS